MEKEQYEQLLRDSTFKLVYKNMKFVDLAITTAGIYSIELHQLFDILKKLNAVDTAVNILRVIFLSFVLHIPHESEILDWL